jgi:hypothetical protein
MPQITSEDRKKGKERGRIDERNIDRRHMGKWKYSSTILDLGTRGR